MLKMAELVGAGLTGACPAGMLLAHTLAVPFRRHWLICLRLAWQVVHRNIVPDPGCTWQPSALSQKGFLDDGIEVHCGFVRGRPVAEHHAADPLVGRNYLSNGSTNCA